MTNTTMETTEIVEIRQALASHIEAKKYPLRVPARGMGVVEGTVSDFLADKYKGNNANIAIRARSFLERETESTRKVQRVVATRIAERVFGGYKVSRAGGRIGIAFGESGIGKTKAVEYIRQKDPSAIIVEADSGYSPRDILVEICDVLKIRYDKNTSVSEMKRMVLRKIGDTKVVILVDEANEMRLKCFEHLRRLWDRGGIGILYVGDPRLNAMLQKPEYRQLNNRIYFRIDLDRDKEEYWLESAKVLIEDKAPMLSEHAVLLFQYCRKDFRRLDSIMDTVLRLSEVNDKDIDEATIHKAVKALDEGRI